jgi:hypothetical protein
MTALPEASATESDCAARRTWLGLCLFLTVALLSRSLPAVSASGGDTVTNYSLNGTSYVAHAFTTVGTSTLTIIKAGTLEVLVVAGGGGGGGGGKWRQHNHNGPS